MAIHVRIAYIVNKVNKFKGIIKYLVDFKNTAEKSKHTIQNMRFILLFFHVASSASKHTI